MSIIVSRRRFLSSSAAGAILGFPLLLDSLTGTVRGDANEHKELLKQAKDRMAAEKKPGVVIVVRGDTAKLANDLATLLGAQDRAVDPGLVALERQPRVVIEAGDESARIIFCQAVFICLPADKVKDVCRDLKDDTAAVLLDAEGKSVDQIKLEADLFGKDFTAKMTEFLHGKEGNRLDALVKAQQEALGKDNSEKLEKALQDLDADDFETRSRANELVEKSAPKVTALLAKTLRNKPSVEVRSRIERMVGNLYASAAADKPSARLPFGVKWVERKIASCGKCGMSSVPPGAYRFLQFVTKP